MKLLFTLCSLLLCSNLVLAADSIDPSLEQAVGRAFLFLAKRYEVQGAFADKPKIWTKDTSEHKPGIRLEFFGPLIAGEDEKKWRTFHETESQSFVVVIHLDDQRIIRIKGSYGWAPLEEIDTLIQKLSVLK